jgi:hypothetical protein
VQAPWRPDVQRAGAGEFRFRIKGQVTATRITVDTLVEDFFEMGGRCQVMFPVQDAITVCTGRFCTTHRGPGTRSKSIPHGLLICWAVWVAHTIEQESVTMLPSLSLLPSPPGTA